MSLTNSFHGRTLTALSATGQPQFHQHFFPFTEGFVFAPVGDLEALKALLTPDVCAVMIELVQGEGGVMPLEKDYVNAIVSLCAQKDLLLIVDEVQTGMGRTGKLWACEHYDLHPDILCLAKGLAGGVPIGATLFGGRVTHIEPGVHGSTFGGNPLAAAAALATLDVVEGEDLPGEAARKGAWAMARLRGINARVIREVRGMGLLIGIDLRQRVTPYLRALMDEGVLALPAGTTVLRLLPPLVISDEELARACDAVEKVLTS